MGMSKTTPKTPRPSGVLYTGPSLATSLASFAKALLTA